MAVVKLEGRRLCKQVDHGPAAAEGRGREGGGGRQGGFKLVAWHAGRKVRREVGCIHIEQ